MIAFVILIYKEGNMIYILGVLLAIVWVLGGGAVSLITGWEVRKTRDLLKIIFWPITVFICKN